MPRAIWKGAISFGLVHVPVALYPASQEEEVDFDWLDKRTMDPVGYKRINKRTGKDIDKDSIVKGVKQDNGDYVILSDDEIKAIYPKTTQTIELETFVPATDLSFVYIEKPYYLEPVGKSDKVYALLREAMAESSLIGIARLVIHNKEHLAALVPAGPALMVGLLRWANEIRSPDELALPASGKAAVKPAELTMAKQLIKDMSGSFKPEAYRDEFAQAIRDLVAKKAQAGEAKQVEPVEDAPDYSGTNVVDLAELLKQSLGRRGTKSAGTEAANDGAKSTGTSKAKPARKASRDKAAADAGSRQSPGTRAAPRKRAAR